MKTPKYKIGQTVYLMPGYRHPGSFKIQFILFCEDSIKYGCYEYFDSVINMKDEDDLYTTVEEVKKRIVLEKKKELQDQIDIFTQSLKDLDL